MKQCFVFFTRRIDWQNLPIIKIIIRQLEGTASVYVLSYVENEKEDAPFDLDLGIEQLTVSRNTLTELFSHFPNKYSAQNDWKIMPGNLDLAHLAFYLSKPDFDYYWFCEDDVRYTDDFSNLLKNYSHSDADLLATNIRPARGNWGHTDSLRGIDENRLSQPPIICFLPFFRVSKSFLDTLYKSYQAGVAGHHEISWPSIAITEGLKLCDFNDANNVVYHSSPSKKGLSPGTFVFFPPRIFVGKEQGMLYHPVKNWKFVIQRRFHYFVYNSYSLGRYYLRRMLRIIKPDKK